MPDPDAAVVQRARAGDREAFGILVERHAQRVHAVLLHLVNGDADLAAELTQEAFVRAWERLDRFAGTSRFTTWLHSLARNRAIDLLRARASRHVGDGDRALEGLASSAGGPHEAGERAELAQQVQAGLARLAAEDREIILLRDFQDLGYDEIALALGCPVGTVKSRLHRARAALRAVLAPAMNGGRP